MRITEPYTIFPRKLKSGKTVYHYQYRNEQGQRSNAKSTACTSVSEARRMCQKLYNSGAFKNDSAIKFRAYTEAFFSEESRYYKWKVANKESVSKVTLQTYNRFMEKQLLPYFSDFPMTKIKRSDVKECVIWANERWSPKTVNSAQTVLNIILKQAVDEELIASNPCSNLAFRTILKKQRKLLTIDEVRAMYNSGKPPP